MLNAAATLNTLHGSTWRTTRVTRRTRGRRPARRGTGATVVGRNVATGCSGGRVGGDDGSRRGHVGAT